MSFAQEEHPFISQYDLTILDGRIHVGWTMQGGSTCNGSDIERSTNGVDFIQVHRILGICGDPTIPVSFSWIDASPPEFSTVHYRIKLGYDGYSSVRSVEFMQLTESSLRFFPLPMKDEARLMLNVEDAALVDLWIFDSSGRLAQESLGRVGNDLRITMRGSLPGVYGFMAISEGRRFQGRFVKE